MHTRYIFQSGKVSNKRRLELRDFSLARLFAITLIISTLFITNPSNEIMFFNHSSTKSKRKSQLYNMSWSDLQSKFYRLKEPCTNYGICSFSKSSDGLSIWMLHQKLQVCNNYGEFPDLCDWLSRNICHGIKVFESRPLTAFRMIQILKIISFLLDSCYLYGTLIPVASATNILSSCLSVFYQPKIFSDMMGLYCFVYPALELMERICISGTNTGSEASLHFYCVILIFFCTGVISNMIGNYLSAEPIRGMLGSIAACLGYISAAKPRKVILELWLGLPLTAGDILFGTFTLTLALNLFGFRPLLGKWNMGICISWAIGGLLGHIIADRQIWLYQLWWWSF
jgi:hypothetical protein